jgi:hypothetical protein
MWWPACCLAADRPPPVGRRAAAHNFPTRLPGAPPRPQTEVVAAAIPQGVPHTGARRRADEGASVLCAAASGSAPPMPSLALDRGPNFVCGAAGLSVCVFAFSCSPLSCALVCFSGKAKGDSPLSALAHTPCTHPLARIRCTGKTCRRSPASRKASASQGTAPPILQPILQTGTPRTSGWADGCVLAGRGVRRLCKGGAGSARPGMGPCLAECGAQRQGSSPR